MTYLQIRAISLLTFFLFALNVSAADCPMLYKTVNYYGGYGSCSGIKTIAYQNVYTGACQNSSIAFTLSAFFPSQTKSTATIAESRYYPGSGNCTFGTFTPMPVQLLSCTASIPYIQSEQVADKRECGVISSFSLANESYEIYSSETENLHRSFNLYNVNENIPMAWSHSGGKTRIEYRIKIDNTLHQWQHLNTYSDTVSQGTISLYNILTSNNALNSYPYSLYPNGSTNIRIYFRIRTEDLSGSIVSAWRYPKGIIPTYNEVVNISTYNFPDSWGDTIYTQNYNHSSGSVVLYWPMLIWGGLYQYSYLTHNGNQITIPTGQTNQLFINLPAGVHSFTVTSCDLDINDGAADCKTNKTNIILNVN